MNTETQLSETDRSIGSRTALQQPAGWMQRIEQHPEWTLFSRLPIRLAASVPLTGFRIASLLELEAGQTIGSSWPITQDVALKIGAVQLCWTQFEVVEQRMAVRLTRLA